MAFRRVGRGEAVATMDRPPSRNPAFVVVLLVVGMVAARAEWDRAEKLLSTISRMTAR